MKIYLIGGSVAKDKNLLFEILEIKNVSTNIVLINFSESIEVLFTDPSSVNIGTKKLTAAVGQLVSIKAKILDKENRLVEVLFIGKISEITVQPANSQKMAIKLNQYDKAIWKNYLEKIESNKSNVEKLFNSMRDDE